MSIENAFDYNQAGQDSKKPGLVFIIILALVLLIVTGRACCDFIAHPHQIEPQKVASAYPAGLT